MLEIILLTNGVRTTVHGTQTTAKLSEEVNLASKFEFTVNYGDESFDNVFPKITRVMAYDTQPNNVVFEGYVDISIPKANSDGTVKKQVSAVHISAMLSDACVVGFEDASGNLSTMVSRLLSIYNATARINDRIFMGTAPVSGGHPEVVHIASATCWDALTQIVVTEAGYSFRVRYSGGEWYLDIADDFGEISKDDLIYGVNLTEISQELNAAELYTRIIPIGGASYIPDDHVNPTMSLIQGTEGMPLTLYKYFQNDPNRIYIANEALEAKYPVTAKIVQYDDIVATDDTDFAGAQASLYSKASRDAARLTDIIESYEANAIDLSRAGYEYDLIELNKMYRVVNNKIGIDTYLQVTSKKTDYSNPAKSDLTFGGVGAKASKWMSRKGKSTDQKISSVASGSYKTTNTRMGGMSMRNQSKTEYDGRTHDANTLYTVSDAVTGKVELYLGDTKISGEEGGGVEVQTAMLLDANNVGDWIATQELMLDISTNTKLLYGGHGRLVTVQGYPCWFGSGGSVSLTPADVSKFGNEMHVNMWRRDNASDPYTLKTYDCVLYVNSIQKTTSGGVDHIGYKFMIVMTKKDATTGTVENVWKYTTPFINDVTDAFIVMAVTQLSFLDTFTVNWSGYTRSASTPYGYVESMNAPIKMGYVTANDPNTVHTILFQDGGYSYYLNIGGNYMCIPLGSEAEKCCNMSLVTRTEPSGGNNNV